MQDNNVLSLNALTLSYDFDTQLIINRNDQFASYDEQFKNTSYKSYQLIPSSSQIKSMEIIVLKEILTDILQAKIQ